MSRPERPIPADLAPLQQGQHVQHEQAWVTLSGDFIAAMCGLSAVEAAAPLKAPPPPKRKASTRRR